MATCAKCGNDYDKSFSIDWAGQRYVFDSFECAISMLAPRCAHCGCVVIGHGVESSGHVFCCASCARFEGFDRLQDRSEPAQRRFVRSSTATADPVDEASIESFPASDPPSFSGSTT